MLNVTNDNRDTVFVDLDGCLVWHQYDPESIPDVSIDSLIAFIQSNRSRLYVIVTTSRSLSHANLALEVLSKKGFIPDGVIHSLPTGKRIVINDHKEGESNKSVAINLVRNHGI